VVELKIVGAFIARECFTVPEIRGITFYTIFIGILVR
jgi:hypothetical protein